MTVYRGTGSAGSGTLVGLAETADLASTSDLTLGDALIGFKQSDASGALSAAVAQTLHTKMQSLVSVFDFMTAAQRNDVLARTALVDVSGALTAAFDYVRARTAAATTYTVGVKVVMPPGLYRVESPIDATAIRSPGWGIIAHGATLVGHTTGKCVLDLMYSRFCEVQGLSIYGDVTNTPKFGIQIGRLGSESSDCHTFKNVAMDGYFTKGCLYNYASEDLVLIAVRLFNRYNSSSAYCLINDGLNYFGVSSDYQTVTAAAGTAQSFNDFYALKLDCRKITNTGPCIYMSRTSGHRYMSSYCAAYGGHAIEIESDSYGHKNLSLDIHCETTGLVTAVKFTQTNTAYATPTVKGFKFHDYGPMASQDVFNASSVTTVTIENADIAIPGYLVTPSSGMMNPKASFKVYGGSIYSGAAAQATNLGAEVGFRVIDDRASGFFGTGTQLFVDKTSANNIGVKGEIKFYDAPADATTGANLGTNSGTTSVRGNQVLIANAAGSKSVAVSGSALAFDSTGPTVSSGAGSPEGVVTAPKGSMYLRNDGGASTSLYIKESGSGNTGWAAK